MLKPHMTALGSIAPVIAIVTLYFALGADGGGLGVLFGVCAGLCLLGYVIAAIATTSGFGEFIRGWLIGMNAGSNAVLGYAAFSALAGAPVGAVAGAALGVINLLCVLAPVTQNSFFQGVLGWLNWVLPMSWLVVALGALFYFVSFLLYLLTAGRVAYLKIEDLGVDWKTGTFFIKGGLIANLNYLDTAFNMGNFSFVDYKSSGWHKEHEAGHTLNLAAFGSLFHFVGAFDENVLRNASSGGTNIPMWS
jgi:hypothetical protein